MDPRARRVLNDLLRRLADGDREAARPLFDALWPELRAFCRGALRDSAEVDDVAQEALMKVFAQASRFDPDRDALAWSIEIAAWEVRTQRRKGHRSKESATSDAGLDRVDPAPDAAQLIDAARSQEELGEAFASLAASDRDVIRLVLDGNEPPDRGAAWRKRKERAIKRLRTAWRAIHAGE